MENILTPAVLLDNMQTTLQDIMEYWKTNNGGWKDDLDFNVYKSDTYKEEKINEKDPNFNPIEYLIDNADELSKQIDVKTYATETRKDIVDKDGKHYKMKTSGLNGFAIKSSTPSLKASSTVFCSSPNEESATTGMFLKFSLI